TSPALYTLSLHDALPILALEEDRAVPEVRLRLAGRAFECFVQLVGRSHDAERLTASAHHGLHGDRVAVLLRERARRFRVDGLARSEEHTSELQSRFDLVC